MGEVIIAHTNDTLKSYINTTANDIINSDTIVFDDSVAIVETAEKISKVLTNTENILVFNLEARIAGSKPSELKAAELIYHLRATHRLTNPIVVVAMQTLSAILRQQPDLTILNAQGVYFADVLSDFSFLEKIKTHYDRYTVKDIKKEYQRHFQNKLNAAQVRHEQANIYGLKQLVKIHKAVTGDEIIIAGLNTKDNLDFLLADFVFGENERQYVETYNNDEEQDKAYVKNLAKIEDRDVFVIDDQSKMWLPFYKAQLEGSNVVDFDFDTSNFDTHNNIGEADWITLKDKLSEEKDWIILLDLRINPNEDNNRPLESISGILLLKRIKEHFPYIPVIITTASNKSKTLAKLASMKIDGYWVKEGIDNGWTPQESIENYFRLPELVSRAVSEHFYFLKSLSCIYQKVKNDEKIWIRSQEKWLNGDAIEIDLMICENFLAHSFIIYKRHCRDFIMNFNYSEDTEEYKLSLAGLINNLGSLSEVIFDTDRRLTDKDRAILRKRHPKNLKKYMEKMAELRNKVSHGYLYSKLDEELLFKAVETIDKIISFDFSENLNDSRNKNEPENRIYKKSLNVTKLDKHDFYTFHNLKGQDCAISSTHWEDSKNLVIQSKKTVNTMKLTFKGIGEKEFLRYISTNN